MVTELILELVSVIIALLLVIGLVCLGKYLPRMLQLQE